MAKAKSISKKKASKAVNSAADFATDNGKSLLILLGIGIGGYMLYRSVSNSLKILPDFESDPNSGGGNLDPHESNSIPRGGTITINQAEFIAAGLVEAMQYPGTDEQRIFALLRNKNIVDFALISQRFGRKRYSPTSGTIAVWPIPKQNLSQWLFAELSDNALVELKRQMPGVL